MPKLKTIYVCTQCQSTSPKWSGQCPQCGAWNSFEEEVVEKDPPKQQARVDQKLVSTPQPFSANLEPDVRFQLGLPELERVLGGGLVPDSFTLLTGDPGIGKSTLALQLGKSLAEQKQKVLYISGEESPGQIGSRAERIGCARTEDFLLLNELELEKILATILAEKPTLTIIDSIQVIFSPELGSMAGSINQIRFAAENLMRIAKEYKLAIVIIGHVTKDGNLAGPMVLSHLVDTVLYLEGDKHHQFRLLRGSKNRFGPTSEVGVFEMKEGGLIEVQNPSAAFLAGRLENALGSSVTATMEGTRPFLSELQALTTYTKFGYPKRTASGYDLNRLQLMIAVLNKYADLKLDSQDVFVNVVGGMRVSDPASDLAICLAIASSKLKKPLPTDLLILGEVGLSGEIRAVNQLDRRIKEAQRLGFKQVLIPRRKVDNPGLEVLQAGTVPEAIKLFF